MFQYQLMMLVSLSCGFVLVEIFRYEHLFYFIYQGMIKCSCEFGVYVRSKSVGNIIIVCLYMDDLLITGGNKGEITKLKRELMNTFERADEDEKI